jgi:ceramide glucosyltransferase
VSAFLANFIGWASVACYAAAVVGSCYALFAAWAASGFVRSRSSARASTHPAVTILKPLHGAEPGLRDHLAGFCVQDYPNPVQIVFGVADPADPAIAVVRKLIVEYPERDLTLVVNSRRHGVNAKVSNLINMLSEARHDVLVTSDSDIVVAPDYLQKIVASLDRPGVGLVTCLYQGIAATGIWSRVAAAAIDYHFLPNVLVGLKLALATPCFGSTIALRRATLAEIGGFEAVADQLADDYALGARVRGIGLAVAIPHFTVAHVCTEGSARALFRHEMRWARTIRSVDPLGFAGLVITHGLPFALFAMVLAGITPTALTVVAVALACRFALALAIDRAFAPRGVSIWLLPLCDLLSFAIFIASFFGRAIEWRGHRYGVRADNTLAHYSEVET